MKRIVTVSVLLLTGLAVRAQSAPPSPVVKSLDVALGCTTIYANAPPPGVCGCFWMNGGSAQVAVSDPLGFGLVADVGVTTADNIGNGTGHDVTLEVACATLYTGGFSGFVAPTTAPVATGWNEPAPGRDLHPLWPSAFTRRIRSLHYAALRSR